MQSLIKKINCAFTSLPLEIKLNFGNFKNPCLKKMLTLKKCDGIIVQKSSKPSENVT